MPRERSKPPSLAEQVEAQEHNNSSDRNPLVDPPVRLFLPTGCAVLNCVLSDRTDGGWPCGRVSNLVGDTDTGKTLLALNSLAEAANNEAFDDYDLYHIDREGALSLSKASVTFGWKFAERVKILSPANERKEDQPPETIEEYHFMILDWLSRGRPFVAWLDSLDNLPSKQELEETDSNYQAWKKNKDQGGSYNMSKQKYLKRMLRELATKVMETSSVLGIISQTIAAVGSQFKKKERAGGSGLDFNSRVIPWLRQAEPHRVKGQVIGRRNLVNVAKNHITHKKRECSLWIYDEIGVDDTKTSVDFLIKEGVWPQLGGWIDPKGMYDKKYQSADLIKTIEADGNDEALKMLVQHTWNDIENSLLLDRKRRYE